MALHYGSSMEALYESPVSETITYEHLVVCSSHMQIESDQVYVLNQHAASAKVEPSELQNSLGCSSFESGFCL